MQSKLFSDLFPVCDFCDLFTPQNGHDKTHLLEKCISEFGNLQGNDTVSAKNSAFEKSVKS